MNRAAADRLDVFLDRLDRTGLEDLEVLTLPAPDWDLRSALLARVDEAASGAGGHRTELVRDARLRVREILTSALRHCVAPGHVGRDRLAATRPARRPPTRATQPRPTGYSVRRITRGA
ncbi:MAG: hypothetical protein H0U52_06915 [Chloroflexi bacterium]|nr:hypothetical protein [Chloroflexota bacterium]